MSNKIITNKQVGERIEERMLAKNLNPNSLAVRVGMTAGAIGNYISGTRSPKVRDLIKIAGVLETTVSYLCHETNDPSPIGKTEIQNLQTRSTGKHTNEEMEELERDLALIIRERETRERIRLLREQGQLNR